MAIVADNMKQRLDNAAFTICKRLIYLVSKDISDFLNVRIFLRVISHGFRTARSKRTSKTGFAVERFWLKRVVVAQRALSRTTISNGTTLARFHQHFTRAFFVWKLRFGSFSSYILALAPKFCQKNAQKCWWNWHLGSISPTFYVAAFMQADPKRT